VDSAQIPSQRVPVRADQVLITGDVVVDRLVATADLDARVRPPQEIRYTTRYFEDVHRVQGVPLHEVLTETGIRPDPRHKIGELNMIVLAVSEDGYQVALSWAEIDPDFGACAALLATRYNDERLTRPTLVMPCDGRASRFVRRLWQLRLHCMTPAGPDLP
jgi:hypothetical protein